MVARRSRAAMSVPNNRFRSRTRRSIPAGAPRVDGRRAPAARCPAAADPARRTGRSRAPRCLLWPAPFAPATSDPSATRPASRGGGRPRAADGPLAGRSTPRTAAHANGSAPRPGRPHSGSRSSHHTRPAQRPGCVHGHTPSPPEAITDGISMVTTWPPARRSDGHQTGRAWPPTRRLAWPPAKASERPPSPADHRMRSRSAWLRAAHPALAGPALGGSRQRTAAAPRPRLPRVARTASGTADHAALGDDFERCRGNVDPALPPGHIQLPGPRAACEPE